MPKVDVFLNRTRCDFEEIEGLPIQLTVGIDKFLEVDSRLIGTRLDGALKQLVIPATRTNNDILSQFWLTGNQTSDSVDCIVMVDGQNVFAGKAKPKQAIRSYYAPKQYTLDLYGGSGGPLVDLEDVLLSDIDMGTISTDNTAITNSWTHNFGSSAATATFAPVVYGAPYTTGRIPRYMGRRDMRPHITYTHIIESIIEGYLGYNINSTFHDTEYFRRWHYVFGIGDQWLRSDSISNYQFEYDLVTGTGGTFGIPAVLEFTSAVSDPLSMWNGTEFTAPQAGYYSFSVQYLLTGVGGLNVLFRTIGQGSHNFIELQGTKIGSSYLYELNLQDEYYETGEKFFILANTVQTTYEASGTIKGTLKDIAVPGSDVYVASCLHKNPVKDFLRGVFHQFNLTGRFDIISKQFYYEPRMAYQYSSSIGTGHAASFTMTDGEGYYQKPSTAYDDWRSKVDPRELTIERVKPFKDNLVLGFKESKDKVTKAILKEQTDISGLRDDIPVCGVKYPMGDGDEVVKSINPYFHNLPNIASASLQPGTAMAACLPDSYIEGNVLPTANFEFVPTCAFYYGLSGNDDWNYEGTDRELPMFYQQPPQGGSNFIRYQDSGTYADTGSDINAIVGENKGLVKNFYLNYLQCVKHGEKLTATVKLRPEEVFSETFRNLKYFLDSYWILTKIVRYDPRRHIAKVEFYRYTYGIDLTEYNAVDAGMSTIYNTLVTK